MSILDYKELIQKINSLYKILTTVNVNDIIGIIGYLLVYGEYIKYVKSVEYNGKYYCSAKYASEYGILYRDIILLRNLIAHGDSSSKVYLKINNIIEELYKFNDSLDDVTISLFIDSIGVSGLQVLHDYFYNLTIA